MTSDWSSGYVSEITYTYGFYRELAPTALALAAQVQAQSAPDITQPLAYCELGCGQGLSTNILAAANPHISFVATDFNPAQIAGAQALAHEAKTPNVRFLDDSFEQMVARADLPDFDIIALHGIYSWVSVENRGHIVEFIKRRLKPGGIVYISYNTLPGWASAMPMRQLFVDSAADSSGPILGRIEQALQFTQEMETVKARFFSQNPGLSERLARLKGMPPAYLAHEYFNRDWTPFYFKDVATELSGAKLNWIASAHLIDSINAICFTSEQTAFLDKIKDPVRREGLRDYMVNQQFRRDLFAKGALKVQPLKSQQQWLNTRFVLTTLPSQTIFKVSGPVGELQLQEKIYGPVIEILKEGAKTIQEIMRSPGAGELSLQQVVQAMTVLVGGGHASSCLPLDGEAERKIATDRFNDAVIERARYSADIGYLASPVTGSGHAFDRAIQLFLLAHKSGTQDPVGMVWGIFKAAGQRFVKNNVVLSEERDNIAEVRERYEGFMKDTLPLCQTLKIA